MDKFTEHRGTAAPLPMINVDTDMIIPKLHLQTITREGLGKVLFEEMRYTLDGAERDDFVLNQAPYREASILVAGENFGCGSSREHAPWALKDFGIRCIIAPSFADIFYNNCFKNGMLPIQLPQEQVDLIMAEAEKGANAVFTIDLGDQSITLPDGTTMNFEIDGFRKACLLEGLDEVGVTLKKLPDIEKFEEAQRAGQPWLYGQRAEG